MSLERFMKVYSSLPLKERELTIIVVNDEPINWKRAYSEIQGETDLGETIQKRLEDLDII